MIGEDLLVSELLEFVVPSEENKPFEMMSAITTEEKLIDILISWSGGFTSQ